MSNRLQPAQAATSFRCVSPQQQHPDPDEKPTACGWCGGETFWHHEPGDDPELFCLECVAFTLADE
jgi:hypothetical protein